MWPDTFGPWYLQAFPIVVASLRKLYPGMRFEDRRDAAQDATRHITERRYTLFFPAYAPFLIYFRKTAISKARHYLRDQDREKPTDPPILGEILSAIAEPLGPRNDPNTLRQFYAACRIGLRRLEEASRNHLCAAYGIVYTLRKRKPVFTADVEPFGKRLTDDELAQVVELTAPGDKAASQRVRRIRVRVELGFRNTLYDRL